MCCKNGRETELRRLSGARELFSTQSEGRIDEQDQPNHLPFSQPPHLAFPDHVHRLITLNRSARRPELSDPLLGVHAAFGRSVLLFQDVVQVLHRSVPATAAECPFLLYVRDC